jgi:hypothetical protein
VMPWYRSELDTTPHIFRLADEIAKPYDVPMWLAYAAASLISERRGCPLHEAITRLRFGFDAIERQREWRPYVSLTATSCRVLN